MPSLSPPQRTALTAAAAAGAVVSVAALTWSVLRRQHHDSSESAGAAPEEWTPAQVVAWLHENGVSKAAASLCLRYRVNGETLLRVTERDLYRMGVPLRDARVILAAAADLQESSVLPSRTSPAATSRQPSPAGASSHPPAAAPPTVTTAAPGERFEAAWNALVRTCVLPANAAAPSEQQQRVVVYTSALLECFQALSPREQATALALVASAEDGAALTPVSAARGDANAPPSAAAATPTEASNPLRPVEAKLQPLHAMVDGFLQFLQSPELDAVPPEDFAELGERVAGQVKRVVRVCEQLPAEMSTPLLRKCERVFEVLASRDGASREEEMAAAAGDTQEDRKEVMAELYDVISRVKDPALRSLPPAQRLEVLTSLAERAMVIEQMCSGTVQGAERDEQVLKIVQPVLQLIREAARLSAAEAAGADVTTAAEQASAEEEEEGEEEAAETEGEEGEKAITSADIPVIVDTIRKIQQTLQSEEFRQAPAEVQAQLCAVLSQRISALQDRTDGLPPPTQNAVRELLSNTQSVLAAVGSSATAAGAGVTAEGSDNEREEEKEEEGEGEEAAQEAPKENGHTGGIERYVEQLERIFDFLTSEALERAPAGERAAMAAELMQRVDKIRQEIGGSPAEGPIVSELIEPLYELLQNMASAPAPSRQFLEVTAPLKDVQELLSSPAFQQAPHAEKMRIARGIVPQLQQLTATFAQLPPSERAAAEKTVQPISEELLRIVRERPATQASAQGVLDGLQSVMRTIQGAEFTTMSPAARGAWAAKAVGDLEKLNDDCVALGAEGDALRPIVQRLEKQLRGLFAMGDGAPRESNGAVTPAEEGSMWATVRSMQAELARADAEGSFVPPSRLQQMLSVLGAAADVADTTEAEEELLQAFGDDLRRHVEAATAVPLDGEAEDAAAAAAENGEEKGNAEDALDSLRVSLQTLLDVALEDGGVSAAGLSSVAAKTEELIAAADEAGVAWREDGDCARAVRSILEILQQTSADAKKPKARTSAASGAAPSKVEEVLLSSIKALAESPPSTQADFAPFMRVLQLAQPAAEHMTNRELGLLKTLQESVIEAMQGLTGPQHPVGEAANEQDDEEEEEDEEGGGDDVDMVLDALLDMSFKLRDSSYTAAQLDEFEKMQHDLEELLTQAGVDSSDAMASVREQIRLQRHALHLAEEEKGEGEENEPEGEEEEVEEEEEEREEVGETSQPAESRDQREGTQAFNEDDDDAASEGAAVAAPRRSVEAAQEDDAGEEEEDVASP